VCLFLLALILQKALSAIKSSFIAILRQSVVPPICRAECFYRFCLWQQYSIYNSKCVGQIAGKKEFAFAEF